MAGMDTARSLAKKTKKLFSSLSIEERGDRLVLTFVGEPFVLAEASGGWRLGCAIPVPAAIAKLPEAKLRKWFESLDPKEPYADRAFSIESSPAKGAIKELSVSIVWKNLDALTPAELVTSINSLRTGAMYVRTKLKELA